MKPSILFFLLILCISPWEKPKFQEKGYTETYKFPDKAQRLSFIRFPKTNVMVSYHCVYKSSTGKVGRNCMAWKPYQMIDTGEVQKLFEQKNRILPDTRDNKAVSFFICKEAGGYVNTEANEYTAFGRKDELMDFCEFEDGSITSISYIRMYLSNYIIEKKKFLP
ncbi:MAG: hypothetical protein H7A23_18400 [Leptospiraceae bacterium]|nr:hypothetical protein [Leptospiraceae bacterium]MCP5496522.1 hypothetical protein [Leptospiraceae bacterium]